MASTVGENIRFLDDVAANRYFEFHSKVNVEIS
jgi:hypothetical protein